MIGLTIGLIDGEMKMQEIPANKIEDLALKIETHLRIVADEIIEDIEGSRLLKKRERAALCQRAISDPAISLRVKVHSQAWLEDVSMRLFQLVDESVGRRLQRAAKIYQDKEGAYK